MREGWEEVLLGDLLTKIIGGGTPSKSKPEYWNGDLLWCSVKDMQDDKFALHDTEDRITELGLKNSSANLIKKGTVITATRMGLGRAFIAGKDMVINQDLKALIPNDKVNNKYLLWLIIFNRNNLLNLGTGSTVKGIRLETLRSLQINLPPLKTQRKIASILSEYDDLIENNLKRIKLLEEQAQQTYEEWFVRFKFPGYESVEIDEESGLPFGWERVKCFDVMEVLSGGTPKTNNDEYWNGIIEFYTPKDASNGVYTNGTEKHVTKLGLSKCNSKLYPKDTVFITARGTVGKINLAATSMAMNQSCYALKGRNYVTQYFLYNAMLNIVGSFKSAASGGVFDTIVVDTFKFSPFVLPDSKMVEKYSLFVTPIFESILNLQNQNQHLKEARDILLPRLMSGMIDVDGLEVEGKLSMVAEGSEKYN
tara:strand:+ start:2067 stop:3335 length:1269 start_codon:yes stop_codon:yes gene_type:complete